MARIRTIKPEFWTSETIARIAPNATLVPQWKDADSVAVGRDAVVRFLAEHTPG